jgi:RNA polymerase sigma-70 factor (ECF subfamily)
MPDRLQDAADEELARQARAGSLESFERLVERYEDLLLRFLLQRTGNRHDAEDLTQAAFVAAWKGLPRYDDERPFRPWLYTIAARQAISHARARRQFEPLTEDALAQSASGNSPLGEALRASPSEPSHRVLRATPLGEALRASPSATDVDPDLWRLARERLPEAQSTALWLMYGEEMSVKEIARITGRTQVHVKVLLHRGRKALAAALGKETTP